MTAGAVAPKVTIVDQLAQIKVKPEQIKFVGISHYHADHTGQLPSFPASMLLIGKGDWDGVNSTPPMPSASVAPFAHWRTGGGKVEPLTGDKVKKAAANLKATVIIQHDARDVDKLPNFPAAAK